MSNIAPMNSLCRHRYRASIAALALLMAGGTAPARAGLGSPDGDRSPQVDPLRPGSRTQAEDWAITYVVRPALESGTVEITAVLVGETGSGVVWCYAGAVQRRGSLTRPEAYDGFGQQLRVAVHPRGWMVTGGSGAGMRLVWRVTAPGPEPVGVDGLGIGAESLYAQGYELFLAPDPELTPMPEPEAGGGRRTPAIRWEVFFDIPISWRIIVPWNGFGRRYEPVDPGALWGTIIAAGDFRRQSVRAAGVEVTIGIQGRRPAIDATVGDVVRRILLFGQQVFGVIPGDRLTVLLPTVAPGGGEVLRLGGSAAFGWESTVRLPGDVEALHQLTREILGLWQGALPGIPAWYSSGVTDYLAWLVLMRESLIPRGTFRQELLMAERRYRDHPYADRWSFAQEEARFSSSGTGLRDIPARPGDPAGLARSRGVVVALALDATLARLTGGQRRLTDLAGLVYRRVVSGEEDLVGDAALMAACAELTGGDFLDDFFRDLVFMPGTPPVAEALADIMGREGG